MIRLAGLGALALLVAAIVHIVAILLVPAVSSGGPGALLAAAAGSGRFAAIAPAAGDGAPVAGLDPSFVHGACRVPGGGVYRVRGTLPRTVWSLALVDGDGFVRQGIDDRSAVGGAVDVLVGPAPQLAALSRQDLPEDMAAALTLPFAGGVALLRVHAPTPAAAEAALAALAGMDCGPAGL